MVREEQWHRIITDEIIDNLSFIERDKEQNEKIQANRKKTPEV